MMHDLVLALADDAPRQVAGGDDAVVRRARHGEAIELADDGAPRPRRVGDQDRRAAPLTEARQGLAGWREGLDAVVDHAPDVAQDHVIAGRDLLEARDEADGFGLFQGHGDRGFWREPRRYGPTRAKSTRAVSWRGEGTSGTVASAAPAPAPAGVPPLQARLGPARPRPPAQPLRWATSAPRPGPDAAARTRSLGRAARLGRGDPARPPRARPVRR